MVYYSFGVGIMRNLVKEINGIKNTLFFAGDMKDMLTQDFIYLKFKKPCGS